uniref:N-acetyltransferase n=1 Tax=Ignisphaera aggregans TaxID=334771 RepID=A0A7C2ZR67_9CREN
MYTKYVSKSSVIENPVFLGNNTKIYGPSRIGSHTFVDSHVVIGYPTRQKILGIREQSPTDNIDGILDALSAGASIGRKAVIRSGTVIYETAEIGDDVELGHNVVIRERTSIGFGCKIGTATVIDGNVVVGENTVIQSCVYIPPGVRIGRNVFIAPRVVFTNDRYPPSKRLVETVIEDNVVIGANAVITPGVVLGTGSVIAAGAVVTRSIEPYTVVAGVPARRIMKREEYEEKKKAYEEAQEFPYR